MKKGMLLLLACCFLIPALFIRAQEVLRVLEVGEAALKREKIAVYPSFYQGKVTEKEKRLLMNLERLFQSDFSFYRTSLFTVGSYEEERSTREQEALRSSPLFYSPDLKQMKAKGIDYLIQLKGQRSLDYSVKVIVLMFDVRQGKQVYKIEEDRLTDGNYREKGHLMTHEMFRLITGKESIFRSKIFFVSDRDSTSKKFMKELYMMDFDGYNPIRLTHHEGLVVSPEVSPDITKVAYTLIEERNKNRVRNLDLYVLDLTTPSYKTSKVSTRQGINSGAAFFPDSNHLALTLSISGTAQIYVMSLSTKELKQITTKGENVDPSISQKESMMAFLSDRAGRPMIYKMDPSASERGVERLSYVGKFHATPRIASNAQDIVFASWVDNAFDLYRIDTKGQNIIRLTKDFGNNENPSFSPDSEFIVFTNERVLSRKKASFQLLVMDRNGEVIGNVSSELGNCYYPRWVK